jgi:soluble lytic murein transglycosylase-like protein
MISVQKAIFPGIVFGCLFLVFITGWIANPQIALASNPAGGAAGLGVQTGDEPVLAGAPVAEVQAETQAEEQPVAQEAAAQPVEEAPAQPAECSLSPAFAASIQQWCRLIERYAGEHGVEPSLIASVMLQESGGNPDAYSKSGAVGLMQVMPKDGLAASFMCVNGPCFASRPSMDELFDPEFNVAYGVRMLAGLIQRHGSVREALRSYGPMNMGYRYADIVLNIQERYR